MPPPLPPSAVSGEVVLSDPVRRWPDALMALATALVLTLPLDSSLNRASRPWRCSAATSGREPPRVRRWIWREDDGLASTTTHVLGVVAHAAPRGQWRWERASNSRDLVAPAVQAGGLWSPPAAGDDEEVRKRGTSSTLGRRRARRSS